MMMKKNALELNTIKVNERLWINNIHTHINCYKSWRNSCGSLIPKSVQDQAGCDLSTWSTRRKTEGQRDEIEIIFKIPSDPNHPIILILWNSREL